MPRSVIITCALTGSAPTPARNSAVPVSPREIATSAIGAARAGAAIVHIHVRNPETAEPSMELEHYREVVARIRDSGVDVLVNLTTGPGARFVPDRYNPTRPARGTTLRAATGRVAHVLELEPEICSIDFATMNRDGFTLINVPDHLREMMQSIQAAGVKPEMEVFDGGHLELLREFIAESPPAPPHFIQFCLGIKWGMPAEKNALAYLVSRLPGNSVWSAFGIGRHSLAIARESIRLGGHIRVGFEDNIYLERGVLADSNSALVDQGVNLVSRLGHSVATADDARRILHLRGSEHHQHARQLQSASL